MIGTKQTVSSGVYEKKIAELKQGIGLKSLATPLLVPMIEEGIYDDEISGNIIKKYLDDKLLAEIKALILGCTHYPIIHDEIKQYYEGLNWDIDIIDSANTVAKALRSFLDYNQLMSKSEKADDLFYVFGFHKFF